ncbi:MAG TPA: hypothetical protein DCE42_17645 [Myxococcales bacterium]|nr:hypothetical protein [Deltaproteobacteria bacterium]MBU52628.1 hypothetical protein [Deltaproteobacteria bacterium]HAA56592.1 hypothetical protein [Myxococcales bacterium]
MRCSTFILTFGLILCMASTRTYATESSVQTPKTNTTRPNTNKWFEPSYLIDWGLSLGVAGAGLALLQIEPPTRPFRVGDPSISNPYHDNTISTGLAAGLSAGIPLALFGLSQIWVRSGHDFHHAALGLFEGISLTFFTTTLLKVTIGRLRPDFIARCQPDSQLSCTGDPELIRTGRRSFPSGHSSAAFAGGMFLSLYLWGKLQPLSARGTFWKLLLSLSPLFGATMMGVSRIVDNRHHWEDVLVGAFIGMGFSWLTYHLHFPAPWSRKSGTPKRRLRVSLAPMLGPDRFGFALSCLY